MGDHPPYMVITGDNLVYHIIDQKRRLGTLCGRPINQNSRLHHEVPDGRKLCDACAMVDLPGND